MKLSKKVGAVLAVTAMMTTTVAGASVDWKVTATSSYEADDVTAKKEVGSHSYATITRTSGTLTEQARTPLLVYVQAQNFSQYKSEVVSITSSSPTAYADYPNYHSGYLFRDYETYVRTDPSAMYTTYSIEGTTTP